MPVKERRSKEKGGGRMKKTGIRRCMKALAAAVLLTIAGAFSAQAGSADKTPVPVSLHLDVNSRQTAVYDGYTSYVMGNRISEKDTFTITKDENGVNLDDVILNYYLITYEGDTQKSLECRVYGLKEGEHYPVVRPETMAKESEERLYDSQERCYVIEFARGDERSSYYFSILPEGEMPSYRNIHLGSWEQDKKGWRYLYQDAYLTSWAMINDRWYLFGMDGYMKTGWQEYKGAWYYLNPDNGVMMTNCTIDGFQLDGSGMRV